MEKSYQYIPVEQVKGIKVDYKAKNIIFVSEENDNITIPYQSNEELKEIIEKLYSLLDNTVKEKEKEYSEEKGRYNMTSVITGLFTFMGLFCWILMVMAILETGGINIIPAILYGGASSWGLFFVVDLIAKSNVYRFGGEVHTFIGDYIKERKKYKEVLKKYSSIKIKRDVLKVVFTEILQNIPSQGSNHLIEEYQGLRSEIQQAIQAQSSQPIQASSGSISQDEDQEEIEKQGKQFTR